MNKLPAIVPVISRQLVAQYDVNRYQKQIKQVFSDIEVLSRLGHTSMKTYYVFPPSVQFYFQQHGLLVEERYTKDIWGEAYTIVQWSKPLV